MNIDIRTHIKENFKNMSLDDIKESILETISDSDEIVLPGFGVFFELLWNNSSDDEKDRVVSIIYNSLNKKSN